MEISQINPDGNVYDIKDATSRTEITQIKAQNVYSTAETNTGKKWINGKPIYRRVYIGTYSVAASARTTIITAAELGDIENMFSLQGWHVVESNVYSFIPNLNTTIEWHRTGAGAGIQLFSESSRTNCSFQLCFEYTKTTD